MHESGLELGEITLSYPHHRLLALCGGTGPAPALVSS
jgi:hypothetical protein